MVASRMQIWALILSAHNYTIKYRNLHANTDGLSRLPLEGKHKSKVDTVDVYYTHQMEILPSSREIRRDTMADPRMSSILEMVTTGRFPADKDTRSKLSPFLIRSNELTVQQGCLMWGIWVTVPPKLRPRVLAELHVAQLGVVSMKSLACSYVWWPGIDAQVELQSQSCNGPQFCSEEFAMFLKSNGVKHTRSVPFHPSTKGHAERFVQFLLTYWITPICHYQGVSSCAVSQPQATLSTQHPKAQCI